MKLLAFFLLLLSAPAMAGIPDDSPRRYSVAKTYLVERGFSYAHLESLSTGHHLLLGRLNGQDGRFLVDTGAAMSVIDQARARHFSLNRKGKAVVVNGVAGSGNGRLVSGGRLEVNGETLRIRRLLIADMEATIDSIERQSGTRFDGVIGQDVLNAHEAIIDVNAQVIFFRR